jgi:uncharacterized protein YjiS (DUF1127 family)
VGAVTDAVIHSPASGLLSGIASLGAWLRQALQRAALAERTRRELSGLPDEMLRDIGITRGDIPYIGAVVAHDELFMRDLTQIGPRKSKQTTSLCGRDCGKCKTKCPAALRRAAAA